MKSLVIFLHRSVSYLRRCLLYLFSIILHLFLPIKKNQVLFWADSYMHYGCNPKYISEYLSDTLADYTLIWAFNKGVDTSHVRNARIVFFGTLEYLFAINESEFIITNQRINSYSALWEKRRGQKYIMTWHGSYPLKMIMADANNSKKFKRWMLHDSSMCDLILSDSDWFSNLIRSSFWYNGEILQKGIPRNDIFYDIERKTKAKAMVCKALSIKQNKPIILYAPTFRDNRNNTSPYITEWTELKKAFDTKFHDDVQIVMRLHPNMINSNIERSLLCNRSIINATYYDDMQEILCSADLLITDYSSCMFDISLLHKPCLLYIPDIDTYERNFYFSIKDLPFPVAYDLQELINNVNYTDFNALLHEQDCFLNNSFSPVNNSNATKAVVDWMLSHSS